jgi:hypothetical protein
MTRNWSLRERERERDLVDEFGDVNGESERKIIES